jgi:diguanylate cyclase (GGDEF)-like protein
MERTMPEINPYFSDLVRQDALTNSGNHVSFFDWLVQIGSAEPFQPFTLLSTEIRGLSELNRKSGRETGDTALRWAANQLNKRSGQQSSRMGNEFLTALTEGTPQDQANKAKQVYTHLNSQATVVGLKAPAAYVAGISFTDATQASPENILSAYYGALYFLKQKPDISFKIFDSSQMSAPSGFISFIVNHTVSRLTSVGRMLDRSNQLAFSDPISELPNTRAGLIALEETVRAAQQERSNFSILLVDGDTLKNYNQFSYSGGDELIHRLGNVLRNEIRPSDYICRWKTGDQFLIILHGSLPQAAAQAGERMRVAVEQKSKDWMIHSTISVGVAGCPQHGKSVIRLIEVAESALKRAKQMGKNRVAIFS